MTTSRFNGVLAPVITPFKSDLSVDAVALLKHCQWLQSKNIGLAVFGTNSEANSLSVDEKVALMEYLVAAGINPDQMMPGTGCCALPDTVALTSHAMKLGCRGVLMLPPFYYKGVSDDGLFGYYSEVIARVADPQLRIYLYHIPQLSGVGISPGLIERLIEIHPETIAGIKDSGGDWENTLSYLQAGWKDFRVFCGSESFLLKNMQHGGAGCISATANVNPDAIYKLFVNWQGDNADQLQSETEKLRQVFQNHVMIPALKSSLAHFSNNPQWRQPRPPLMPLEKSQHKALIDSLNGIGFRMNDLL